MKEKAENNVFGEWLKEAINKKRISPGEFSQKAKISRSAVYFYLDGSRVPDQDTVVQIASALGVGLELVPSFERKLAGRPRVRPTS